MLSVTSSRETLNSKSPHFQERSITSRKIETMTSECAGDVA